MPTSREELLEQLRKLRRLAADVAGTPEAAAATRKVRELMKRYGISAAELRPPPPAKKAVQEGGSRTPAKASPTSTPATITLRIGSVRIRWKL